MPLATTVDALLALCVPPAEPVRAVGDWVAIEGAVGLTLPADFKRVVESYGEGQFAELLSLLHPFTDESSCIVDCGLGILAADRACREVGPTLDGRPLHPDPGGLFPFARTDNGDVLYWVTSGEPDSWTVFVANPRADETFAYGGGCAEFLLRWLGGEVQCALFPARDEYFEARFDPRRDLLYVDVFFHFDGDPFEARVELLRGALGGTRIRGVHLQDRYSAVQLRADDGVSRLQYSDNARYGARLNLLVPREDEAVWRARIAALRDALCWPIRRVHDAAGEPRWPELVG